jgi:hypothetical protein
MSSPKSAATKEPAAPSPKKAPAKKPAAKSAAAPKTRPSTLARPLAPAETLQYDPDPKRLRLFRLDGRVWVLGEDLMRLATGFVGNTANICAEPEDWRDEAVELDEGGGRPRPRVARLVSLWGAHEYCVRLFTQRSYALWRWLRHAAAEEEA